MESEAIFWAEIQAPTASRDIWVTGLPKLAGIAY